MITSDRRRVAVATLFTLVALPAVWVLNRETAATSRSPKAGAVGADVQPAADGAPPSTTAYTPEAPLFVGGDSVPPDASIISIAVPPTPSSNEVAVRASFKRFGAGSRACTALMAPSGVTLTVVNVDNGQQTTCINSLGALMPAGVDIVLNTDVFVEIADLADAPVPVRVSW